MDETPHAGDGLRAVLARMFKTLRDAVENRVELFLVEWREERLWLVKTLLLLAAGIVCALMALLLVTLTVVVIFWDTHRVLALALAAAAYAAIAAGVFAALRCRLRKWQAFSATLGELKKDRQCFEKAN